LSGGRFSSGLRVNYRHDFHAGNFADLVKHACLLSALGRMTKDARPIVAIDTHAGAGVYDLTGDMAKASGEADAGVRRLMADPAAPPVFAPLKAAITDLNKGEALRFYPGSPWLIARTLRPGDQLVACELRPDDRLRLEKTMFGFRAKVLGQDGFAAAPGQVQPGRGVLTLIDPPFEKPDDYDRIAATTAALVRRDRNAVVLIWLPLKDLETFDHFLRRLEAIHLPPVLIAEARLRPLDEPMRMNGCALAIVNPPEGLEHDARVACDWTAANLGGEGAQGRCWRL
jgi:23S rRNA (adenine2030-N6)-methyltransferase